MFKSIDDILPRTQNDVKSELEKLSATIDNAVDFGTHLLKWQADKMQSGDHHLVPILFFRNILELTDAISILIKNSSIDPTKILLRSLLENSFGLEYLLEKDQENRSLSNNVWIAHKDLKFIEKLNLKSQIGKQFSNEIKKDKFVKEIISDETLIELDKKNSIELLELPIYKKIEEEYQRTKKIIKNPKWYSLFNGPTDIEQLAKRLNHYTLYEIVYRKLSDNVHATDLIKNKLVQGKNGQTDIIQIRFPKDAQDFTVYTLNILIMTYLNFYEKVLPERNDEFLIWYSQFQTNYKELIEKKLFNINL
ncbi:hypothetical protein IU405_12390 [Polaribacter sp. BAL334]|uniref:DUF5677 domain-containing protein n=1 Tax=Polaribacter sp. BAL334 TaxID=1708178 RepID=UPI0018D202F8|nr:DUF5677 domain-containing protein [Polaribacter sp. BAL334]MBG7613047.1 hypothetical protein [Polaribacter sp. BAL334]